MILPEADTIDLEERTPICGSRGDAAGSAAEAPLKARWGSRLFSLVTAQKTRLQNLSVLVFVNFITAGLGFVTIVKIANVMGKEKFGELAYALALGAYGAMIVRYGFNRTLVRDLIHYPDRFGSLVLASLALRVLLLVLVLGGLIIWKVFVSQADGLSWAIIIIIIGVTLRSLDLQAVYDTWHRFQRHAIYNLIQRCLYFAIIWTIILLFPNKLALYWIGSATICSVVFYLVLQHRWAMKKIDRSAIDVSLLPRTLLLMLRQNVWIWLAAIAGLSFGSLNQVLLKHYKGALELGGYAAAWQIVVVAEMLLLNIARIGNPATAKIAREGTDYKTRIGFLFKYAGVLLLVSLPICIPALICPALILKTMFRPEYASAAPIVRVFAVYIVVFGLDLVATQYVISAHLNKTYCVVFLLGCFLSICFCVILIPQYGALGASVSLLLAHGVAVVVFYWAVVYHIRSQFR